MPDYGRLTAEALPHANPVIAPSYPAPPWGLPGARVLKLIFETATEPVLRWLPPKLSRSSPPYALITVASFAESPAGPFSLATQYIGCRAGFFIRAYALQAVVDSPSALSGLREIWGIPCKLGEVSLSAKGGKVAAQVSRGGKLLAQLALAGGTRIDTDAVRFDPVLTVRTAPSLTEGERHDLVQLVQIDPEYEIKESLRGRGSLTYPEPTPEDPWDALPMLNMISAAYCRMDTEMPLARFVMPY